jgi:hypothetical protein
VSGEAESDSNVEHGALLVAFVEGVMGDDEAALERERTALCAVLTPAQVVDVAALIGMFNVVDRVADATGIPLDSDLQAMSGEISSELDLARFQSSANTLAKL